LLTVKKALIQNADTKNISRASEEAEFFASEMDRNNSNEGATRRLSSGVGTHGQGNKTQYGDRAHSQDMATLI
jgi:hypothetical protein